MFLSLFTNVLDLLPVSSSELKFSGFPRIVPNSKTEKILTLNMESVSGPKL